MESKERTCKAIAEFATHCVPEVQHCLRGSVVPRLVGVDAVGEEAAGAADSQVQDEEELNGGRRRKVVVHHESVGRGSLTRFVLGVVSGVV